MAYLTYSYLQERKDRIQKGIVLHEALEKKASQMTKIFLSHRHKDKKVIKDVVGLLTEYGGDVYIDVLDYSIPDITDGITAKRIKKMIKESKKFILLATQNSLESKWIPWELGLGDAISGMDNVAILPLLNNENNWKEREYYQIYGTIEQADDEIWGYFAPNSNNGTLLKNWLNKY